MAVLQLAAAATCVGWSRSADAGVFSVTPVRIYMAPRDRAVAVTITNEGDAELVLQADLNAWSQGRDGSDEQVETEDLILSPPILRLGPQAKQVVRLALLRPADPVKQLTYRMIVREVPEARSPAEKAVEVPIALALSLPVFVTPLQARREVECVIGPRLDNAVTALCTNQGTAYAQVREITVLRNGSVVARFEGGAYILPGGRQAMKALGAQSIPPGAAQLKLSYDDGKAEQFEVTLP